MSLACECDNPPDFYNQKTYTARVQHTCCECRKPILPGQEYKRTTGKWAGVFYCFKTCEKCTDLGDSMMAQGFCVAFGELHAAHQEYIHEYKPPRLTTGDSNGS